jgi:hypothetical protein
MLCVFGVFFFVSVALFVVDGIKTRLGGTVEKPRLSMLDVLSNFV